MLDINVSIAKSGQEQVTLLGLEETLPEGWSFVGLVDGNVPLATVSPGTEGLLEFGWLAIPAFPVVFRYRLLVPPGTVREQRISGQVLFKYSGGPSRAERTPDLVT